MKTSRVYVVTLRHSSGNDCHYNVIVAPHEDAGVIEAVARAAHAERFGGGQSTRQFARLARVELLADLALCSEDVNRGS